MMIAAAMTGHSREQTGDMIPLLLRHEIQVLLRAGHAQTDVASRAGVSIRTIRRVLAEDAVTQVDDREARRTRNIGRPSKATVYGAKVRAWLAETPDLPTQEL